MPLRRVEHKFQKGQSGVKNGTRHEPLQVSQPLSRGVKHVQLVDASRVPRVKDGEYFFEGCFHFLQRVRGRAGVGGVGGVGSWVAGRGHVVGTCALLAGAL